MLVVIVKPELWAELRPKLAELVPKHVVQIYDHLPGHQCEDAHQPADSISQAPRSTFSATARGLIVLTDRVDYFSALVKLGLFPGAGHRIPSFLKVVALGENIPEAITLPENASPEVVALTIGLVSKILRLTARLRRRRRMVKALKLAACRDPLTGLFNRRGWSKLFPQTLREARSRGENLVFAIFDVDQFKSVDDRLGHARGDQILRELAEKACHVCRRSDAVIRWGGDEFALLLRLPPEVDPEAIVDRVRAQLAMPVPDLDGLLLTASAGMSVWKAGSPFILPAEVERKLFEFADGALREAKRRGGNITLRSDPD